MLRPPLQSTVRPSDREPSQDDVEQVRAWQEARLQRRLRGAYESEQTRLAELVGDTLDAPLRIANVQVHGATHTSDAFLGALVRPHLASPSPPSSPSSSEPPPSTLASVLSTSRAISQTLEATDLFRTLSTRVERTPAGAPGDVDLVVTVTERGRFFVKTATELGNAEGTASLTARLTNLLGRADTLTFNTSVGTKTKRGLDASFALPVVSAPWPLSRAPSTPPSLATTAFVSLVGADCELGAHAAHGREERVALRAGLRHAAATSASAHELSAEALWRSIGRLAPDAAIGIRQSAGPALKAALAHVWTRDTLDDRIAPARGASVRVASELALSARVSSSGGTAADTTAFCKVEGAARRGWALAHGLNLSLAARTGFLHVLAGTRDALHWSDRFQLGGPLCVRAFAAGGMGPRDGTTSLGGTVYYALGASLVGDVPSRPAWPVKLHAWLNAGRLDDPAPAPGPHAHPLHALRTLVARPSLSAGVGLLYRLDPIRAELNIALPLVCARGEGLRRGLQVGIGLELL